MKKKTVWSIAAAMLLACLLALTAFAADTAITNANVNLRSGPGTTYNCITVIPAQTEVGIQAPDSNGWTKVEYKGQVGYVLTSALGNNASGGTTTGTAGATGAGSEAASSARRASSAMSAISLPKESVSQPSPARIATPPRAKASAGRTAHSAGSSNTASAPQASATRVRDHLSSRAGSPRWVKLPAMQAIT